MKLGQIYKALRDADQELDVTSWHGLMRIVHPSDKVKKRAYQQSWHRYVWWKEARGVEVHVKHPARGLMLARRALGVDWLGDPDESTPSKERRELVKRVTRLWLG